MKRYWITVIFKEYRNGFNSMDFVVPMDSEHRQDTNEFNEVLRVKMLDYVDMTLVKSIKVEDITCNLLAV